MRLTDASFYRWAPVALNKSEKQHSKSVPERFYSLDRKSARAGRRVPPAVSEFIICQEMETSRRRETQESERKAVPAEVPGER